MSAVILEAKRKKQTNNNNNKDVILTFFFLFISFFIFFWHLYYVLRSRDSLLVRAPDSWCVIEGLRVRIPVEAAGEFSFPELAFCAGSYSASIPLPRYRRAKKCRWQTTSKHAYTLDSTKSEWAVLFCPGIVWAPIRETSSHATRQGTLVHKRPSSLYHCGLILA